MIKGEGMGIERVDLKNLASRLIKKFLPNGVSMITIEKNVAGELCVRW